LDSFFRYDFNKIGCERRNGYAYHGTWAASLLQRITPSGASSTPSSDTPHVLRKNGLATNH